MLQAARYVNNVENPPGLDRRVVIMGAYDFPYEVAAREIKWSEYLKDHNRVNISLGIYF